MSATTDDAFYIKYAHVMKIVLQFKQYLTPRMSGINGLWYTRKKVHSRQNPSRLILVFAVVH